MAQPGNLKILWEGQLPLENVKWGKISPISVNLPHISQLEIKNNWKVHLKTNPKDYDGNLLFLNEFKQKGKDLILNGSNISFSTIIYLIKNNIKLTISVGMLGVQYLIFSPNEKYLLVGERSLTQEYYPGKTTAPGGMLELNDTYLNPKTALLRELKEEVPVNTTSKAYLIAIVSGWNGVSVTFMIKTKLSKNYNFNPLEIITGKKSEWESGLKWISLAELKNLSNSQLLDGLLYFKSKIEIYYVHRNRN